MSSSSHVPKHMWKTRLCAMHKVGRCPFASQPQNCPGAHTEAELKPYDRAKLDMCKKWQEGCCLFSAKECRFAHGKGEQEAAQKAYEKLIKQREQQKAQQRRNQPSRASGSGAASSSSAAAAASAAAASVWGAAPGAGGAGGPGLEGRRASEPQVGAPGGGSLSGGGVAYSAAASSANPSLSLSGSQQGGASGGAGASGSAGDASGGGGGGGGDDGNYDHRVEESQLLLPAHWAECAICFHVVEHPVLVTPCLHVFCDKCLEIWFKEYNSKDKKSYAVAARNADEDNSQSASCPECNEVRKASEVESLTQNRGGMYRRMLRLIQSLPIVCKHDDCTWSGYVMEFQSHSQWCPYAPRVKSGKKWPQQKQQRLARLELHFPRKPNPPRDDPPQTEEWERCRKAILAKKKLPREEELIDDDWFDRMEKRINEIRRIMLAAQQSGLPRPTPLPDPIPMGDSPVGKSANRDATGGGLLPLPSAASAPATMNPPPSATIATPPPPTQANPLAPKAKGLLAKPPQAQPTASAKTQPAAPFLSTSPPGPKMEHKMPPPPPPKQPSAQGDKDKQLRPKQPLLPNPSTSTPTPAPPPFAAPKGPSTLASKPSNEPKKERTTDTPLRPPPLLQNKPGGGATAVPTPNLPAPPAKSRPASPLSASFPSSPPAEEAAASTAVRANGAPRLTVRVEDDALLPCEHEPYGAALSHQSPVAALSSADVDNANVASSLPVSASSLFQHPFEVFLLDQNINGDGYRGAGDGELDIPKGAWVEVLKRDPPTQWGLGRILGRPHEKGWFPLVLLKMAKMVASPNGEKEAQVSPRSLTSNGSNFKERASVAEPNGRMRRESNGTSRAQGGEGQREFDLATPKFPWEALQKGQLSVLEGELLRVVSDTSAGSSDSLSGRAAKDRWTVVQVLVSPGEPNRIGRAGWVPHGLLEAVSVQAAVGLLQAQGVMDSVG